LYPSRLLRVAVSYRKQLLTAIPRLERINERLNLLFEDREVSLYGFPDLVEVYPEIGVY